MRTTLCIVGALILLSGCSARPKQPKLGYDPFTCTSCLAHDIEGALQVGDPEKKALDFCASRGMYYVRYERNGYCTWEEGDSLSSSSRRVTIELHFDEKNQYSGFKVLPPYVKSP